MSSRKLYLDKGLPYKEVKGNISSKEWGRGVSSKAPQGGLLLDLTIYICSRRYLGVKIGIQSVHC